VFVPLEPLFAMHPQQNVFRRDWGNDLVFLLFNGMLIKLGLLDRYCCDLFCRRLGTGHPHAANRENYFPGKSRGRRAQ